MRLRTFLSHRCKSSENQGFALVVTLSLMILLTITAVGLLSLASVELRKSTASDARATAMANARLGLMLALGQLQTQLGDDRRITADASMYNSTKNPAAVGVWNGWSPDLGSKTGSGSTSRVDYNTPKGQTGFRGWLVSSADPQKTEQLDWHTTAAAADSARLFSTATSGFDLDAGKIPLSQDRKSGTIAWAVTQENTKARINIGADDGKRISQEDRLQAPSRPNLSLSALLRQPEGDWSGRPSRVCSLSQAALDGSYGVTRQTAVQAARDYTVESLSLLTNPVKGGLKTDLTTGFDMSDSEFAMDTWSDSAGQVKSPFRSATQREYKGQKPLFTPVAANSRVQVFMNFDPASVNQKFQVNGAPTYDTLRAYYRSYRNLYTSGGGLTAFERPYSHISTPDKVSGRPFGVKSHPALAPVLDRVNFLMSIYAKTDGTLCILLTPFVTIWNPHNVDIETEGLVIYPWIDFAVYWNWNVTPKAGGNPQSWSASLSRLVGDGYQGHGRSTRPYFYLHLTQSGNSVSSGTRTVSPAIHLAPGEVRVFCLADNARRDLEILGSSSARTWRMKPVGNASDITSSLKSGIALNMTKTINGGDNFNYKLKSGDVLNGNKVEFDRSQYYYIINMTDSWQIKNPASELMVESRPAYGSLPALPAVTNLCFYDQIHAGRANGKGNDFFTYPTYRFEEINESPKLVGSLLTYHRVAQSSSLPLADLMFTTNPRQPLVNSYLSGSKSKFQTGPHYESMLQGGSSLTSLAMETTPNGQKAYYGASHSVNTGRSNLAFFEVPRSPTLSLGSFQHCDISTTAFNCASQIANSWASPYLPATSVAQRESTTPGGEAISPSGLGVYDYSYLANEALFDSTYLSGAAPRFSAHKSATGSPGIWDQDQIVEEQSTTSHLTEFFTNPELHPLRNPRMTPYLGSMTPDKIGERLDGPARCARLAGHLMVEGGFNINSTSEEAWTAVLASLRGVQPASSGSTAQSRFRHILSGAPANMSENDPWSGFRTLNDADLRKLAKTLVAEIRTRGPFLSLGEFVNRRVSTERGMSQSGAIQSAIDKSGLNKIYSYSNFATNLYPNPENLTNPNTGTNTPGWLTQADLLGALAPFITPRSDTFIVRTLGEARDAAGKVLATVRLEAVVQRVPDWIDPADDAATPVADLKSTANKNFGRRFQVITVRELTLDSKGEPV